MFSPAIHAFIQRYGGSRKRAGQALHYSAKVMGLLVRGEMKVPLLTAFLIEELSEGDISVVSLIKDQNRPLALAIHRSLQRYLSHVKQNA